MILLHHFCLWAERFSLFVQVELQSKTLLNVSQSLFLLSRVFSLGDTHHSPTMLLVRKISLLLHTYHVPVGYLTNLVLWRYRERFSFYSTLVQSLLEVSTSLAYLFSDLQLALYFSMMGFFSARFKMLEFQCFTQMFYLFYFDVWKIQ